MRKYLLQQINNQLHLGTGDLMDIADFADHLQDQYISKLDNLGFKFEEYSHAHLTLNDGGVHLLEFSYKGNPEKHLDQVKQLLK